MHKNLILLLLTSMVFSSCWNRNRMTNEEGILLEIPINAPSKMGKNEADFEYLSFKAKANYKDRNGQQSFSLFFKMKRDSSIWASAVGFGFEAARILVTHDSVKVLNRMQKKYYAEDLSKLPDLVGMEVSLRQLQNILIGNSVMESTEYSREDSDELKQHLKATAGLVSNLLRLNSDFRIRTSIVNQQTVAEEVEIQYTGHEKVKNVGLLPTDVYAVLSKPSGDDVEIKLHYNTPSTSEFDNLPFSVPDNYEKSAN